MLADRSVRASLVALDPASIEVDGRDSRDRLAFVANFARLILYYDLNNQPAGDWQPFFLKDPAVLLASISKTEYIAYHAKYTELQLDARSLPPVANLSAQDVVLVNQLCGLLQRMFCKIDQWFHFMQIDAGSYSLHDFLKKKIEESLSCLLWSMVALQRRLSTGNDKIAPPDIGIYQHFEPIWRDRGGRVQDAPEADDQPVAGLCRIYHKVFDVFMQLINSAEQAFYRQEAQPTRYPDTGLLIAFSRLMNKQQSLINQFGGKHLDFYYDRILRLCPKTAQPDAVYVCLSLTDKGAGLSIPAGTKFLAGNYPDNSEILFSNDLASEINHAAIFQVNTLYYDKLKTRGLYLGEIPQPDRVVRNASQDILSWDAFGNAGGGRIQQGFAIASPMLLLQGGKRTITVVLEFEGKPAIRDFISGSKFYLSTEKSWFEVDGASCSIAGNAATLNISLAVSDPAIVPFAVNPDGVGSAWPMLKVMLGDSADLCSPPVLSRVSIQTHVERLTPVAIANDTSQLPNTGTVQILGPVPELGGHYYVGSNECFAKPLQTLTLRLNWDSLPADFGDYYAPYNQYLTVPNPSGVAEHPAFSNTAFVGQWKLLSQNNLPDKATPPRWTSGKVSLFQQESGLNAQRSVFSFNLKDVYTPDPMLAQSAILPVAQAKNGYIYFELDAPCYAFGHSLYAGLVSEISLKNAQVLIEMAKGKSVPAAIVDAISDAVQLLLCVLKKFAQLLGQAVSLLVATMRSLAMRIVAAIRNMLHKAGNPAVPAATSQGASGNKSAALADCIAKPPPAALLAPPNLPYSPRQSALQLDYDAVAVTPVSGSAATYPLQLYHYGAFKAYLAYDADTPHNSLGFANLLPEVAESAENVADQQLNLFQGVAGQGCLYVALSSVCAPCTISLYAEITPAGTLSADDDVAYWYWTQTGWQRLIVVLDETERLGRSGIVRLDIPGLPADMQTDDKLSYLLCPLMPGADFWIAVTTRRSGVRMSYLNTQALKLSRATPISLPAGVIPQIGAGTIVSTQNKIAQIAGIVQPFASFGGFPAEDKDSYQGRSSFYRRVSERLNNKDRAASRSDYVSIAHDACIDLYYAKPLVKPAGVVAVGLVKGYASAQLPNAYTPLLESSELGIVLARLQSRASAMAKIGVMNLRHQTVTLDVSLVISPGANACALIQDMNQILKVYLSPWICSESQQASLAQGIGRAALIGFLSSQENVIAVSALEISLTPLDGGVPAPVQDDPVVPTSEDAILVSAMQHNISIVSAANVASIRAGGRSA